MSTRPMRIAVMLDRLEVGGVEKVAIQQVRAMRRIGHDARLVLLKRRGAGLEAFASELADIPVSVLEDRIPRPLRASAAAPGFAFLETFHATFPLMARRLVRRDEWDVILCHSSYTCLTAYAVQRVHGIPVAALIWDPTWHVLTSVAYQGRALGRIVPLLAQGARRFDRWLVRTPPLVVLGGLAYRDYVAGLGARRILVLHPAAEPAGAIVPAADRAPEILAATAWKHGKDPGRLLPMLRRHPQMRLVLAGAWLDEGLRATFESDAQSRGLADRVEITGAVSETELSRRYARARFVVQSWPSPGFGLSPLEAAAHGTSFVIPSGQGSAELFRDGVDGLIYDPGDPEAFDAAVDRMVADPSGVTAMGVAAHDLVRQSASWDARAVELATALAEVARPAARLNRAAGPGARRTGSGPP